MITESGAVLKLTAGAPEDGLCAKIISCAKIAQAEYRICDKSGKELDSGKMKICSDGAECVSVFDAEYWTLDKTTLYTFSAKLCYEGGKCEQICDRFGFRTLHSDSTYMYLNGFPFYMRAYVRGCSAHEHANNCRLSEEEYYRKNILTAKRYGFNSIRFHSVVPSETFFRIADELGILVHIEMRAEKAEYENLHEMIYGKNDFINNDDLIHIINSLYNHPSLMVYCVGNEIRTPGKKPRIREIRDIIKANDPTRFFLDTCADGEYDRDYVDYDVQHMSYYYPYGNHRDMFADTDMLLPVPPLNEEAKNVECGLNSTIKRRMHFPRPVVAHEVTHYTAWRDFYALKEKFEKYGTPAPWWVDEEIKMIEKKGYAEGFKETLQVTKNFQFKCWKTGFEAIRTSPLLSGFHMLQFADTDKYENSNGVVDCFDDPHGISEEEFCKFNGDAVIVAKLPERIFNCGDSVSVPVMYSNYVLNPVPVGDFSFTLSSGDEVVSSGELKLIDTSRSGLYEICTLDIKIPELKEPEELILECNLILENGVKIDNSWQIWAFPRTEELPELKLDMNESYLNGEVVNTDAAPITVTDKLNDELFERLDRGERVMLIYRCDWTRHLKHKDMAAPDYSFRAVWERYKGVIWDRGTLNGGTDKAVLASYGFPASGEIDYHYYPLIEDSDKINLDDFPVMCDSIVSGLDKSSRDRFDVSKFGYSELQYDRTMRHFSYAFTVKVGRGVLLVSGFKFTDISKNPATRAMFSALCNILAKEECHADTISSQELKSYLSDIAAGGPQKEGMMTQYWQLDEEPWESMEYWIESERYLREGNNHSPKRY